MEKLNKDKVLLKNILGLCINPKIEDLLFEIVNFLDKEDRYDGVFTSKELTLKTKIRISDDITCDIQSLVEEGYITKGKRNGSYLVVNHPWVS